MDDSRSSTGPPVPATLPMRRVGELPPDRDLFAPVEERTYTGMFPVVRERTDRQSKVTSLLARRLAETEFTDMVMWLDCTMPQQGMAGVVVKFTPRGTFVPHLLELIEEIEVGDQRYHRLPDWDGHCGQDKEGRHDVYIVVEVPTGTRQPPFMTRDVRFVFEGER